MAHLRKQIRDNVVTALTGLSTTGSRVYASRVYPMAAAKLPGLCVYAKSEEVETTTTTRPRTQLRTLTLSVEGFAVATSGLDNTLDAISLEVEEAPVLIIAGASVRDPRDCAGKVSGPPRGRLTGQPGRRIDRCHRQGSRSVKPIQ